MPDSCTPIHTLPSNSTLISELFHAEHTKLFRYDIWNTAKTFFNHDTSGWLQSHYSHKGTNQVKCCKVMALVIKLSGQLLHACKQSFQRKQQFLATNDALKQADKLLHWGTTYNLQVTIKPYKKILASTKQHSALWCRERTVIAVKQLIHSSLLQQNI